MLGIRRTPRFNCRRSAQSRAGARLLLILKGPNCDDFLETRACQLQALVLRQASVTHITWALGVALRVRYSGR